MREIKFRAYNKHTKKMYEVEWLSFRYNLLIVSANEDWERKQKLSDFELMQYTGLKDKNWKELYEGDIYDLKTWSKVYYRWYIRILDTYSGFRHKTIKTERVHRYKYWPGWNKFEIIWNIYENPELLNQ